MMRLARPMARRRRSRCWACEQRDRGEVYGDLERSLAEIEAGRESEMDGRWTHAVVS